MLNVSWYPLCALLPVLYPLYVCTIVFCMYIHLCTIVFCMYIHCNHCMHCCVYSQGGIGNRRKQLEKENKCARATTSIILSILYFMATTSIMLYVLYYTGTTSTSIMFYANVFHQQWYALVCLFHIVLYAHVIKTNIVVRSHVFTHNHYVLRSCV